MSPVLIRAVDELCSQFDLFLFDQYGVLHNGRNTYEGMIDCVSRIKEAGKKVAVISNSGKRAEYNANRLSRFGFTSALVDEIISSGEVAWTGLKQSLEQVESDLRVLYIGQGNDRSAISGLPVTETERSDHADLVIINGSDPERFSLADYAELLDAAAMRNTLAYCTNPDKWSLAGNDLLFGPGQIADNYKTAGGRVEWIGKPYPAIYSYTIDLFKVPPDRIVCIGDSIEHDICGAKAAGCASVLCATGILEAASNQELESLFKRYDATPAYMIRRD